MAAPGETSGTFEFDLSNAAIVMEAFDRIQMRPSSLTRQHMESARLSLNLELVAFSNAGVNLWKVSSGTIPLVTGQAVYVLPANLVTLTEMYYSTVNGNGTGYDSDRILTPITRTQYAMVPNKLQPGTPTQYWFERLKIPQVTLWQPPSQGSPAYVVKWFGLQRLQDAQLGGGETADIVYRALDALCARLAARLAAKFSPPAVQQARTIEAREAWDGFVANDIETGPLLMLPNVGVYGRMGR